ncbi:MAG: GntR family transcriptional regulator [Pseudomonadota bacterium]
MLIIDVNSPVPLVRQLANGLRLEISSGALPAGKPMPSARQLAADLEIHWNTVARAYRLLAEEGLIRVEQGRSAIVLERKLAQQRDGTARKEKLRSVQSDRVHAEQRLNGLFLEASILARELGLEFEQTRARFETAWLQEASVA